MRNLNLLICLFIVASCSSRLVDRNEGRIDPYRFNVGSDTSKIYKNSNKSKMLREDAGNFDSVISNKDMNQDDNCFETVDERLIYTLYDETATELEFQLQLHWDAPSRFKDLGHDLYYEGKTFYSFFVNRYAHIEDYSIERKNENKSEYMEKASSGRGYNVIIPHDAFEVARCRTQEAKTKKILSYMPIFGWYIVPFIMDGKDAISVRLRPRVDCVNTPSNGSTEIISNDTHYCFRGPNVWMGSYDQYYFKLKKQNSEEKEEINLEKQVTTTRE